MRDFHGVSIELAYLPIPGDPLRPLLETFPLTPRDAMLRLELTTARSNETLSAASYEWTPTFCHGLAQGYSSEDRYQLMGGQAAVEIEPRLGRLRARLRAPVTELANGMLHVGFCLLLRELGLFDVHAAVACWRGHAFVVLGDAGAGKTTTLLGLMAAGASYLGDDRVLLREHEGGVELLGYPRDFHVAAATLRAHPELAGELVPATIDGKLRVAPRAAFPERFQQHFTGPVTLLAPRIGTADDTSFTALGRADAFGLLLAASASVALEVLPHRVAQLELLRRLANAARAVELRLGRDFLEEPARAGEQTLARLSGAHA